MSRRFVNAAAGNSSKHATTIHALGGGESTGSLDDAPAAAVPLPLTKVRSAPVYGH